MTSLRAWLTLQSVSGLGNGTLYRLVQHFGSPEQVLAASPHQLAEVENMHPELVKRLSTGPDAETQAYINRQETLSAKEGWTVINILESAYPKRLKMIADPPPLLYLTGSLEQRDDQAVAIVGSRRASPAGQAWTEELSRQLAALGFTIVSGMARGIDAAAHRGALQGTGRTVAVLGCGIDRTYPQEHRSLREAIESSGAVLSELAPGTPPHSYHFPRRNRIISGLCLGVVVAEAALQSGSLITARLAMEQNREVFAVPGPVTEARHRGPHGLIKQGAKLVEQCQDIVEELIPQLDPAILEQVTTTQHPSTVTPEPVLDTTEQAVYNLLTVVPLSVDDVIIQARLFPSEVISILLSLELKGLIRQLPGSRYIRLPH